MNRDRIPVTFFEQDAQTVAEEILGMLLVRHLKDIDLAGYVTETEAYLPKDDPASHYVRFAKSPSVFNMGAGTIYVYRIYGQYHCLNFITGTRNSPGAVLIRSIIPVEGIDTIADNREKTVGDPHLVDGPGKICQAFAINEQLNEKSVSNAPLFITAGWDKSEISYTTTPRVGISQAKDLQLRFLVKDHP